MNGRGLRLLATLLAGTVVAMGASTVRAQKCPNVLVVMQRGASFARGVDNSMNAPSKWSVAVKHVSAAMAAFPNARYGLSTFSSEMGAPGCANDTRIEFPTAPGQVAPITVALRQMAPSGVSNLEDGVRKVLTDGKLDDPQRDNVVILVTSGVGLCRQPDESLTTQALLAQAVVRNPPVRTVVVGFGAGDLDQLAKKGGLPRVPGACGNTNQLSCYYHGEDPKHVIAAFRAAMPAGAPCGCDETCLTGGCPGGERCVIGQAGDEPSCVRDACDGVSCGAGQFCRDGNCLPVCPRCAAGQRCAAGRCVVDDCSDKSCASNAVCVPGSGCVVDRCRESGFCCVPPATCDPVSGACITDPCNRTRCPAGASCKDGWCQESPPPDLAPPDDLRDGADLAEGTLLPYPDCGGCCCHLGGPARDRRGPGTTTALLFGLLCLVVARRVSGRRPESGS